jgi:arylsulfatase A-like enzyme
MAEILSSEGYRTLGIAANACVLIPQLGFDRGFSFYDATGFTFFHDEVPRRYLLRGSVGVFLEWLVTGSNPDALFINADMINSKVMNILETIADKPKPFFLFLNYMDAHAPYIPPPPFDDRYPGRDVRFNWNTSRRLVDRKGHLARTLQDWELRHMTSQYDGAIAYLDSRLYELFETLKRFDLYDNSLIIVTADHGEAFGEKDLLYHGVSVYQHQVHIPLIVKFPNSTDGKAVDAPVSAIDLLPTVLDVVGAQVPSGVEGRSLTKTGSTEQRWIYSESDRWERDGRRTDESGPEEVAIFSGTMKQIFRTNGATEMYDLSVDPFEIKNLRSTREVSAEWVAALSRYLESETVAKPGNQVIDSEVISRLKELGYFR